MKIKNNKNRNKPYKESTIKTEKPEEQLEPFRTIRKEWESTKLLKKEIKELKKELYKSLLELKKEKIRLEYVTEILNEEREQNKITEHILETLQNKLYNHKQNTF